MSKDFFYAEPESVQEKALTIRGEEARHLIRVLRKQEGDLIWVTDGRGRAYESLILGVGKDSVECQIVSEQERLNEPEVDVTLAVGVLRNPARMDWLIEKATEVGVRRFLPLQTARTVAHATREDRWKKIALSAMKQSGRCVLPNIYPLTDFPTALRHAAPYELLLMPYEESEDEFFIAEVLKRRKRPLSAMILIGPEGGFTREEAAASEKAGFVHVSLGRRRLRAETAAVVASSWVIGGS